MRRIVFLIWALAACPEAIGQTFSYFLPDSLHVPLPTQRWNARGYREAVPADSLPLLIGVRSESYYGPQYALVRHPSGLTEAQFLSNVPDAFNLRIRSAYQAVRDSVVADTFYARYGTGVLHSVVLGNGPSSWLLYKPYSTPLFLIRQRDSLSYMISSADQLNRMASGRILPNPALIRNTQDGFWVRTDDIVKSRRGQQEAMEENERLLAEAARRLAAAQAELDRANEAAYREFVQRNRRAGRDFVFTEIQAVGDNYQTGVRFGLYLFPRSRINYIRLTARPYDRTGNVVRRADGGGDYQFTIIGPWEASDGQEGDVTFEHAWLRNYIECARVISVRVEYASGRVRTFTGSALAGLVQGEASNDCSR